MAFGQNKTAYSIFGLSLVAISIAGLVLGWLGPDGRFVWVLIGMYGFIGHVCMTGHFVLFRCVANLVCREETD